ncbi:MAG: hypothetical protein ACYS9X_13920 [Planctomycetota bacterium]|jgi:hypothetical protein
MTTDASSGGTDGADVTAAPATEAPDVRRLCRLTGISLLAQAGAMGIWIVFYGLIVGPFVLDISPILIALVGSGVMRRKPEAYKWGLFFSSFVGVPSLIISTLILADSPLTDPGNITRDILLVKGFATLAVGVWGLANLSALLVISRRERVRFWTRGVTIAVSILAGFVLLALLVPYLATPACLRAEAMEERYGNQLRFLREAAAARGYPSSNSPEVLAAFEGHPEILEAAIRKGNGSCVVYGSIKTTVTSSWSIGIGRAKGEDGESFPVVFYEEPTRDHGGRWVRIRMVMRDTRGSTP